MEFAFSPHDPLAPCYNQSINQSFNQSINKTYICNQYIFRAHINIPYLHMLNNFTTTIIIVDGIKKLKSKNINKLNKINISSQSIDSELQIDHMKFLLLNDTIFEKTNVHIHVRVLSLILVLYLVYIPYKANAMPYKECIPSIKLVLEIKLSHENEHKYTKQYGPTLASKMLLSLKSLVNCYLFDIYSSERSVWSYLTQNDLILTLKTGLYNMAFNADQIITASIM